MSTAVVVASRVLFSFRVLIRAEEDVSDLPRLLSYCGAPLHDLTDLSVIYTPTGVGGRGLWGHQHKVRVGCGSPYQVLKTSRHGVPHFSTCPSQGCTTLQGNFSSCQPSVGWCLLSHVVWSTPTRRVGLCCLCNCPSRNCRLLLDLPSPPRLQTIPAQFLPHLLPGPGPKHLGSLCFFQLLHLPLELRSLKLVTECK